MHSPSTLRRPGGFTLVEIMIVVAIIALLAAIAVPGFLRSRKRSQATAILNEVRVLDDALSKYSIENNRSTGTVVTWQMFYPYLKDGSRLYVLSKAGNPLTDQAGGNFIKSTIDDGIKVNSATVTAFSDVIEDPSIFWAGYR